MSSAIQSLRDVLAQQTELLKELVELLQLDQRSIVAHDVAALESSNQRKEELVLRLHAAERQRQELCRSAATALGLRPEQVTVAKLCAALGAEGRSLDEAAQKLRAVVGCLRELVRVSHGFLEQSILGIRGLLALIGSLNARGAGTYDASGRMALDPHAPPVALRQEV
jgi:flagellar biosynthesis/type III secretory pathway chaperone